MTLAELRVSNVRCFESVGFELAPKVNLLVGENGAGKTSILEAIFLLGRGRSFRTRNNERLIRHGADRLTVFGRDSGAPANQCGIEVSVAHGTRARINANPAQSLLELSGVLPVQAIEPEVHKLVDQGAERRRRWLDWLVFHVEPSFAAHWSRYSRALKQRNAALKTGAADIDAWDGELVKNGLALTEARSRALEHLTPRLQRLFDYFGDLKVNASFSSGWPAAVPLDQALHQHIDRDRARGTTTVGPHRADVLLRRGTRSARETLSRGQQKLTAISMVLSQLQLLKSDVRRGVVLLLDDPAAELDGQNLRRLFNELTALDSQMIATSLTPESALFQAPNATFHVEQGRVIRV
jgi:DNA replication and repair protein RecF